MWVGRSNCRRGGDGAVLMKFFYFKEGLNFQVILDLKVYSR
jgi:hypothetical protein